MDVVAKNFMTNQSKKTHKRKRKMGGKKKQKGGEGYWVKKKNVKEDNCAICGYPLNSKLVYQFVCTHQFHSDCINRYCSFEGAENIMEGKLTCPICRNANTPDVNDCTNVWAYKEDGLDQATASMLREKLYVGEGSTRKKKTRRKPRKKFLKKTRCKPRKKFLKKTRKKRHRAKRRR